MNASKSFALMTALAALGGCSSNQAPAPAPAPASSDPPTGPAAGEKILFRKDGQLVSVDFKTWGTPAYYQNAVGNWRLVVAANEVLGQAGRYLGLSLLSQSEAAIEPGRYDCSRRAQDGTTSFDGEITYAEDSMTRVWKSQQGLPCTVSVGKIGKVGELLEGTFSATLKATRGASGELQISDGEFAVERQDYGGKQQ